MKTVQTDHVFGGLKGFGAFLKQQHLSNIFLASLFLYEIYLCANFDLSTFPSVFLPPTLVSLLSVPFLPSPSFSLPISRGGCLSVSETKQTESCVSGLITPRSSEWELSDQSSCVFICRPCSAFSRYLQGAPGLFLCSGLTSCPVRGCVERKKSGTQLLVDLQRCEMHIRSVVQPSHISTVWFYFQKSTETSMLN